ncbi:MAG: sugar ABC transporter substrate-binding protein [Anaerolineae bacterium]|nr:sugar ABC transporter substrate-binding protein [Anaerolineae bacterium]
MTIKFVTLGPLVHSFCQISQICLCVIGLVFLLGQFAACAPSPPVEVEPAEGSLTIGYNSPALDGAQIAIMDGLLDQAQEKGWQVITTNSNRDSQVQASQIAYMLDQGVRAVVVVPDDSHKICESVAQAREAGVLFYTIDRAPLDCEVNMAVLSDNRMAGRQAGEAMVELLTERYGRPQGVVLEIQGDLNQNVALERGAGFHEIVDQYPDIQVISRPTQWQASEFARAVEEVLSVRPLLDGICLHSDCVGVPAILPILDQMGCKVPRSQAGHIFITGVDGCAETLQAIRDGYVDQTSSQPFPDMGIIVDWIALELEGKTIEPGLVMREGMSWSPASVEYSATGWQLLLATMSVTADNVADTRLWGNR